MSPAWFHLLLVGCIAIQQIVGGISCCCLTVSLLPGGEFASCCAVSRVDSGEMSVGGADRSIKPCCGRSNPAYESGSSGVVRHGSSVGHGGAGKHRSNDKFCSECRCEVGRYLWVSGAPSFGGEEFGDEGTIRAWTSAWYMPAGTHGDVDAVGLRKRSLDVWRVCGGSSALRCAFLGRWNC